MPTVALKYLHNCTKKRHITRISLNKLLLSSPFSQHVCNVLPKYTPYIRVKPFSTKINKHFFNISFTIRLQILTAINKQRGTFLHHMFTHNKHEAIGKKVVIGVTATRYSLSNHKESRKLL